MPELSSFATSAFTTPTATIYTSVMTTRKLGDNIDSPSPDHNATDANPTNQAHHMDDFMYFIPLIVVLEILLVIGFAVWGKRRRQAVKHRNNIHASDIPREMEGNPLLADWAQEVGSKSGLQLLAEKAQGYDGDEYLDRTSAEIGAFPLEYPANESQRRSGSGYLEETFSHPESPTSEAGPSTRWHTR